MDMNESKFRLFNQFMSDRIFLLGESGELSKRLRSEAAELEGWVFFVTCPMLEGRDFLQFLFNVSNV